MKKIYKNLLGLSLGLAISTNVSAQAINEGFENITNLAAAGWVQNNLSTPIGTNPNWVQGAAGTGWPAHGGADFVFANYNSVAGAADISNWLITPSRTFNNGDIVTFWTRTVDVPAYADRLQVRLSVNGTSTNVGTTNSSVGDFSILLLDINPTLVITGAGSYPNAWTQYTITVAGLPTTMTGRMAFRYYVTNGGPSGANSDGIGIDDFVYTPVGSGGTADVQVAATTHPYTITPLAQVTPIQLQALVTNAGLANTSDAMITAKVFQAPNFTTPIQTTTSSSTSINIGANSTLTAGTFTPSAIGDYMVQYISSCTGNTVASNDTSSYMLSVSGNEYARDNGNVTSAFGVGAGPTGHLVTKFIINSTTNLDSVLIGLAKGGTSIAPGDGVGDSTKVVIYDEAAGLPNSIIGISPNYVFTPADTLGLVLSTHTISAIGGGALTLAPGNYYVGVNEYNTNIGLAMCDNVFNNNTAYASWTTQAWTTFETFGVNFSKQPVIRPFLNICSPVSNSQTLTICDGQTVTVGSNTYSVSGTYNDVLTAANGCDSTVTTNLTVNPAIDVTTSVNLVTLTANATGATYQWIDCANGNAIIPGETNASYTASANGNYAVIVTVGSCSDTSACIAVTTVGFNSINNSQAIISIHPNPSAGAFTINLKENAQVVITDALGRVVMNSNMNLGKQNINLSNEANGVYFVKVISKNGQSIQRISISK